MEFLPAVRTTVDSKGKIVVSIRCVSEASPEAVVSWSRGSEDIINGTMNQISNNTTQLMIRDYNVSIFLLKNYTCICHNPLGSQRREIHLRGIISLEIYTSFLLLLVCGLPVTIQQGKKYVTQCMYNFSVIVLHLSVFMSFHTTTII